MTGYVSPYITEALERCKLPISINCHRSPVTGRVGFGFKWLDPEFPGQVFFDGFGHPAEATRAYLALCDHLFPPAASPDAVASPERRGTATGPAPANPGSVASFSAAGA